MPYQLTDEFSTEEQASTGADSEIWADVIPLYREAATPPNIAPAQLPAYHAAPPPIEVPYGWRMVQTPTGWLMAHEPAEWSVIARCVEGRRTGRPLDVIAAELAEENAPIWNGGGRDYGTPRWHKERVRRLVARYAPEIHAAPRPRRGKTRTEVQPVSSRDLSYKDDLEELLALAELNDGPDAPVP